MLYPGLLRACGWSTSWSCLFVVLAMPVCATEGAQASESLRRGRAAAQQELRSTYRYDPTIRQRHLEEQALAATEDVVQLPEMVVHESKTQMQYARFEERRRRLEKENRPSLTKGGDIKAVPGLSVKPHSDLFADHARFKTGTPDVYRFAIWSTAR